MSSNIVDPFSFLMDALKNCYFCIIKTSKESLKNLKASIEQTNSKKSVALVFTFVRDSKAVNVQAFSEGWFNTPEWISGSLSCSVAIQFPLLFSFMNKC
jgi:hypothetical protein